MKARAGATNDPFAFELFKNAMHSLADEMVLTICRTSYSSVVKNGMDFSTAICDREGQLVASGLTQANHLGSVPTAMKAFMRRFDKNAERGDVFILNDPFDGGMHLPDIFIVKPIYYQGQRIAFAATVCHHTDVGGRVAGSNAADSTECYQEGLRIPPLKLYQRGERNEAIWSIIEKNVRAPILVQGDLRAQLAACHIAEAGMIDLFREHGAEAASRHMAEVVDYSERLTRAAIRELPDGNFDFEDWLDDDGIDFGVPVPLRVSFHKRGDRLHVDWEGSSPQVKGALNCTLSFTQAAVYTAVKSVLPLDIPANQGFFRAISVTAPVGSIAHAVMPAATAARALTGFRQLDCCFGALAKMVPERACAASDGGNIGVAIGGYRADRSPFIYVDFHCGAWGGRPWADGLQGNASLFSNLSSTSAEMAEIEGPIRIRAFEFLQDSAGAGKFRGGASFRREYEMKEDEGTLQIRNDRCTFAPFGLYDAKPGRLGRNLFNPGTSREELMPGKVTRLIRKGETFRYEQAGAGGWGDPLERDAEHVLADVRNEYISLEMARTAYGVVVDPRAWIVNEAMTSKLRREMRNRRGSAVVSFVDRGELPPGVAQAREEHLRGNSLHRFR
jgi:N-methylhydantoinase B